MLKLAHTCISKFVDLLCHICNTCTRVIAWQLLPASIASYHLRRHSVLPMYPPRSLSVRQQRRQPEIRYREQANSEGKHNKYYPQTVGSLDYCFVIMYGLRGAAATLLPYKK